MSKYDKSDLYENISNQVAERLQRPLTHNEYNEVINFTKRVDQVLFGPKYQTSTIKTMVAKLTTEFSKYTVENQYNEDPKQFLQPLLGTTGDNNTTYGIYDTAGYLDNSNPEPEPEPEFNADQLQSTTQQLTQLIQQMQKLTTNMQSINVFGISNPLQAARVFNPQSTYRKSYMLLDSRYAYKTADGNNKLVKFQWPFISSTQATTPHSKGVTVINDTREIVSLRIYPFRIPYTESADNAYQRVSVFINEFQSQSFIAHEQKKFHFMLKSQMDGTFIDLDTDNFNDGVFNFSKNLTQFSTLTLSFGSPLENITFDNDMDNKCSFDYFSIAPFTQITTSKPHNLTNGDRVYFSEFDVTQLGIAFQQQNIINNAIKQTINRSEGHIITVINDTNFSIDYDTSAITSPIVGLYAWVYYGSKRLFIPFEITYIMPANE